MPALGYLTFPIVARSGLTAVDTTVPAAPEDVNENPAAPAGWGPSDGCVTLFVDVQTVGATAGNTVVNVLSWNSLLRIWVIHSVATIAFGTSPFAQVGRAVITNWAGKWAYPYFLTAATNATATSISLTGVR